MKTLAMINEADAVHTPFVSLRPVDEIPFQIRFDDRLGAIIVRSNGFWSLNESNRFLAALSRFIGEVRRCYGAVKLMVDARNCSVQSAEAAACFDRAGRKLYRAGDRVAVVATSSLVMLQFQRVPSAATSSIFPVPQEAATWLAGQV